MAAAATTVPTANGGTMLATFCASFAVNTVVVAAAIAQGSNLQRACQVARRHWPSLIVTCAHWVVPSASSKADKSWLTQTAKTFKHADLVSKCPQ